MSMTMERRTREYEGCPVTRRELLLSLSAIVTASGVRAQSRKRTIAVRSLNHMTLTVSDRKRSLEFYQGLFGMPVHHRQGTTVGLLIGSGPQYVSLGGSGAKPGLNHFCMNVEGFSLDRVIQVLAEHGVTRRDVPGTGWGGPIGNPMKVWVRTRGEADGGAKEGTPELYVGDPDGIVVQLQDPSYCGGAGVLGNVCRAPLEPAPRKGLLAVRGLSHFTLSVSSQQRSVAFYQELFGMSIQAHQGASPMLAVGSGPQFLAMGGGGGGRGGSNSGPAPTPGIGHACFTMEGFNPDRVLKTLADFGVKPRGDARGPAGPLVSYVTMRMEDRGGAKGGTPELYFTDPDGTLIQLQDMSYCGGSGYLGNVCS